MYRSSGAARAGARALSRTRSARLRPGGAHIIDVHTHLGLDEDGMTLDPAGLIEMLDQADAQQAVVFPLHDPERSPAYRAAQRPGAGLGLGQRRPPDPLLPPRSGRGAGGRGRALPGAGGAGDQAASARPGLWPGGPGRADLRAGRAGARPDPDPRRPRPARHVRGRAGRGGQQASRRRADHGPRRRRRPGGAGRMACATIRRAVFDSSWLQPIDMLALFSRVPAERIVFGTDPPYGRTFDRRCSCCCGSAARLGISPDVQRDMLGGAAQRLIADRSCRRPPLPGAAAAAGRRAADPAAHGP